MRYKEIVAETGMWDRLKGVIGAKQLLKQPSQFPPMTHDVHKVIAWVKQWIDYRIAQGEDPKDLFDPNGWLYLKDKIHAGISEEVSNQVWRQLEQDTQIGAWIKQAPSKEFHKDAYVPRSSGITSSLDKDELPSFHPLSPFHTF
jgi:uncharacterized protein YpbB